MATPEEQKTFRVFLNLLAVAQLAMVTVAGFAIALIFMLYSDAAARAASPNRATELTALAGFRPVAIGLALISIVVAVGGLISAVNIWRRRARGFSQFVAVLSMLLFPVGTVIGLATLIILAQKPIRQLYER